MKSDEVGEAIVALNNVTWSCEDHNLDTDAIYKARELLHEYLALLIEGHK